MASIKDVAELAKVSISTVSLAINYPERVREGTKTKIFDAMKKLHYVPSSSSKSALEQTQKRNSVALITGEIFGPYYYEVIRGIAETLALNNLEMVMLSGTSSLRRNFCNSIENPAFCGIILTQLADLTDEDLARAKEKNIPIVMCHSEVTMEGLGSVNVDNRNIGKMIANHLMCIGYEEIGILGKRATGTQVRAEVFAHTLKHSGVAIPPPWDIPCDLDDKGGFTAMQELLASGQALPRAFFCLNDEVALGAMQALRAAGIQVPQQMAVIGCDDIPVSKFASPPLSTIVMPKFEMGLMAVGLLLRQMSGKPPENVVLNGKLQIRESCGYNEWRRHRLESAKAKQIRSEENP